MRKLAECLPKSIALHLFPFLATGLPIITIFGSEQKQQPNASHLYIRGNIWLIAGSFCYSIGQMVTHHQLGEPGHAKRTGPICGRNSPLTIPVYYVSSLSNRPPIQTGGFRRRLSQDRKVDLFTTSRRYLCSDFRDTETCLTLHSNPRAAQHPPPRFSAVANVSWLICQLLVNQTELADNKSTVLD